MESDKTKQKKSMQEKAIAVTTAAEKEALQPERLCNIDLWESWETTEAKQKTMLQQTSNSGNILACVQLSASLPPSTELTAAPFV